MELNEKDFVVYRENNQIKSGGYSVKSILLNKNSPALTTFNKQHGGNNSNNKVSNILHDLAVPAGLFYMNKNTNINNINPVTINNDNTLSDSIHDQLLELLEPNQKQLYSIKTRKRYPRSKKYKKTRRTI